MLITTVLNRIENHKGVVFGAVHLGPGPDGRPGLEIAVRARKNGRPICAGCGRRGSTYDHLPARRFHYVPLWGLAVVLAYALRRVACAGCGVTVEEVPWATGKSPVTRSLGRFLADWAKVLAWQEVARRFEVNWHQVFGAVREVVEWGLAHRDLAGITALGVDEIQWGRGQRYLTVVYQLCGAVRRLLFVGPGRDRAALTPFFAAQGTEWCAGITHVCSDMWKAYLQVLAEWLPAAVHILDRFHIVKLLNEAVDQVRRREARELRPQGVDLLKGLKYVFLKRPEHLTPWQEHQLLGILGKRWLRTVRAYLWKEKFQWFWEYTSAPWAQRYLRRWCTGAMHSRLKPLQTFVGTIRRHEALILNWFKAQKRYSSGAVEGMNRKINLVTRKAYGYRSYDVLQIALFHALGHLPEPEMTHRF